MMTIATRCDRCRQHARSEAMFALLFCWAVPARLWNRVAGTHRREIWCLPCFYQAAKAARVRKPLAQAHWWLHVFDR
jgi:hypothetical protein